MNTVKLNNGILIPTIGFGTWKIENYDLAVKTVKLALKSGYRHIDTAAIYGNEEAVGQGIIESKIPRNEIFVTTKLWNSIRGYDETIEEFEESLSRLQMDYVDLYLIHWPVPIDFKKEKKKKNIETYRALEKLYCAGKIKAIGVSNFLKHHIEELKSDISIPVMVNQIEFHPYYFDQETIEYCKSNEIVLEAYSPLGRGKVLNEKIIKEIAEKYSKTPAQICVRYAIDNDIIPLPKSIKEERIISNLEVFDFKLAEQDINQIKKLSHLEGKIGSNPDNASF